MVYDQSNILLPEGRDVFTLYQGYLICHLQLYIECPQFSYNSHDRHYAAMQQGPVSI